MLQHIVLIFLPYNGIVDLTNTAPKGGVFLPLFHSSFPALHRVPRHPTQADEECTPSRVRDESALKKRTVPKNPTHPNISFSHKQYRVCSVHPPQASPLANCSSGSLCQLLDRRRGQHRNTAEDRRSDFVALCGNEPVSVDDDVTAVDRLGSTLAVNAEDRARCQRGRLDDGDAVGCHYLAARHEIGDTVLHLVKRQNGRHGVGRTKHHIHVKGIHRSPESRQSRIGNAARICAARCR